MQINPYLVFDGRCEAAFQFYCDIFGGKIDARFTFRGTPAESQAPPDWLDKIMHVTMSVGDWVLMGADAPPDHYEGAPRSFSVHLGLSDPQEAERIFTRLSENATIRMPMQQTFWAARFGMLVDQFNIPWIINCEEKK